MRLSPIPILLDNQDFVAVNKPAGISVQNETDAEGILPVLCKQLCLDKLWLVHRLDKVTSGILLLAKSQQAASKLSGLFADRQIEKYYLALGSKKPSKKQGLIAGDMQKSRDRQWMLTKSLNNPAVTQFFSCGTGEGYRVFLLKPYTGKTHQIRVAMKSIGSPILGDTLYKGKSADRTYLHALALRFQFNDNSISLFCPPDNGEYFNQPGTEEALRLLSPPEQQPWPALKANLRSKVVKQSEDEVMCDK